jgi:hypothetical protein
MNYAMPDVVVAAFMIIVFVAVVMSAVVMSIALPASITLPMTTPMTTLMMLLFLGTFAFVCLVLLKSIALLETVPPKITLLNPALLNPALLLAVVVSNMSKLASGTLRSEARRSGAGSKYPASNAHAWLTWCQQTLIPAIPSCCVTPPILSARSELYHHYFTGRYLEGSYLEGSYLESRYLVGDHLSNQAGGNGG